MKTTNKKLMSRRRFVENIAYELKRPVKEGSLLARVVVKKWPASFNIGEAYSITCSHPLRKSEELAYITLSTGHGLGDRCYIEANAIHPVAIRTIKRIAKENFYDVDEFVLRTEERQINLPTSQEAIR